ncbi:hypothetical protein KO498_15515 [Lentibacter algarum]|uniref:hypothetical protein n=1 Tax=Lentibacter algarum TaxID=576131 RepID=UPI001C08A40E|nr:hypothetical protein [Lentibacter algarum]MBU2983216.1 hypothetical protein [Lentibacter algarum]
MKLNTLIGAAVAAMIALPAFAEAPTYPYGGTNNCPNGLSPIVMGGVICCGTPNQSQSYASMMSHPVKKRVVRKKRVRHVYKDTCLEGSKGCY